MGDALSEPATAGSQVMGSGAFKVYARNYLPSSILFTAQLTLINQTLHNHAVLAGFINFYVQKRRLFSLSDSFHDYLSCLLGKRTQ